MLDKQSRIKGCFATFLLSSASYLPGVLVLAYTLRKYRSAYPLIVLVNDKVPSEAIEVLRGYGLDVRKVESLMPAGPVTTIAERFVDTWAKMRVFELVGYDRVVLIDSDMALRRCIDELFEIDLPPDWIACAHGCICNLDRSSWAPANWTREACGYTGQRHPSALSHPPPPANPVEHTPYLINSGLVVLTPSLEMMQRFIDILASDDPATLKRIATWLFPDQDFFGYAFADRWKSLPWIYNAIKISRYWHGDMWRDEYAANVHYICGKPWKEPPSLDAHGDLDVGDFAQPCEQIVTGQGCDAVTHSWWWREYYEMTKQLSPDQLDYVRRLVVEPTDAMRDWLARTSPPPALPLPKGVAL